MRQNDVVPATPGNIWGVPYRWDRGNNCVITPSSVTQSEDVRLGWAAALRDVCLRRYFFGGDDGIMMSFMDLGVPLVVAARSICLQLVNLACAQFLCSSCVEKHARREVERKWLWEPVLIN
jgi:hypothetical protein